MSSGFKTPPIPQWIKELQSPIGYANPFQIGINGPNLFGTETLCGDWYGNLLLVAQDFALMSEVQRVFDRHGAAAAWRHNDGDGRYRIGYDTNIAICEYLNLIDRHITLNGHASMQCNTLYINACFFLKPTNSVPSKLAMERSLRVLRFVFNNMPNLQALACLGRAAFDATLNALGTLGSWRESIDEGQPVVVNGLAVFALSHPGRLGLNNRKASSTTAEREALVRADWLRLGTYLRRQR